MGLENINKKLLRFTLATLLFLLCFPACKMGKSVKGCQSGGGMGAQAGFGGAGADGGGALAGGGDLAAGGDGDTAPPAGSDSLKGGDGTLANGDAGEGGGAAPGGDEASESVPPAGDGAMAPEAPIAAMKSPRREAPIGELLETLIEKEPSNFAINGKKFNGEQLRAAVREGKMPPIYLAAHLTNAISQAKDAAGKQTFVLDPKKPAREVSTATNAKGEQIKLSEIKIPLALRGPTYDALVKHEHGGNDPSLAFASHWTAITNGLIASLEAPEIKDDLKSGALLTTFETMTYTLASAEQTRIGDPARQQMISLIRENGKRTWDAYQEALNAGGTAYNPDGTKAYLQQVRKNSPTELSEFVRKNFSTEPWAREMFGKPTYEGIAHLDFSANPTKVARDSATH